MIATVAGNGQSGYAGDGGLATGTTLYYPQGMAIDRNGNLYIADRGNNRIRKVDAGGVIATVAGNGVSGFSGDGGQATTAKLFHPSGVAIAADGSLYIVDQDNNRVRKVDPTGVISTVAGTGNAGYSGDGGPATNAALNVPIAVALDNAGNFYVSDSNNFRIRKIDATGTITTFAGNGMTGSAGQGDGGPATSAALNYPYGITIDASGHLYIAEQIGQIVRKVTMTVDPIYHNGFD